MLLFPLTTLRKNKHNIIHHISGAFVQNKSISIAIAALMKIINNSLDEKVPSLSVLINLERAFEILT